MKPSSALLFTLLVAVAIAGSSCTTAKKRSSSAESGNTSLLLQPLSALQPTSEETIASLKAIADSPSSHLPPELASASLGTELSSDEEGIARHAEGDGTSDTDPAGQFTVPESWHGPGLNPEEVNPGDIFSENEGPVLRKVFSLLDELPASARNPLLIQFTRSKTERVPITISRAEIAEMEKTAGPDALLPTRSVALDFRTETHSLENERHAGLLDRISRGDSVGAATPEARLNRLRKQLATVKKRLHSGEKLHIVTAVAESSVIHATYPGAPIGKRDADLVRNALVGLYPHLRSLEVGKGNDEIEITGSPRILWEFDSRELKIEGDRIVIDHETVVRL